MSAAGISWLLTLGKLLYHHIGAIRPRAYTILPKLVIRKGKWTQVALFMEMKVGWRLSKDLLLA